MAVRYRMDLKGLEDYMEDLANAGQDIDQVVEEVLPIGAEVILNGMYERVPVDTGNLVSNLTISEVKHEGNLHYVDIGLLPSTDVDTARYGNAQEYGTSDMSGQPYIRPSFDEDGKKALQAMKQDLKARGKL